MNIEPNAGRFTFIDRCGHEWDVTLTIGAASRVDSADFSVVFSGPVCLAEPTQELLAALVTKNSLIAAVVWAIVQPQAHSLGTAEQPFTEEQFVERIDRLTLDRLKEAFWGSLCDFFPDLASGFSEMRSAEKRARTMIQQKIEAKKETIRQAIDRAVNEGVADAFAHLEKELGTVSSN
jgi:hypothetical protein